MVDRRTPADACTEDVGLLKIQTFSRQTTLLLSHILVSFCLFPSCHDASHLSPLLSPNPPSSPSSPAAVCLAVCPLRICQVPVEGFLPSGDAAKLAAALMSCQLSVDGTDETNKTTFTVGNRALTFYCLLPFQQ